MKKKTVNELEKGYSGIFGGQVALVNRKGKSIMVMKTKKAKLEPKGNQAKSQDNFTLAARYAKNILLDPDMLAAYTLKSCKGTPPYIVALTDYLRPPYVSEINTRDYEGNVGDQIHVVAFDDFAVTEVKVFILNSAGVVIEKGDCVLNPITNVYDYTATVSVNDLTGVEIIAEARDYPGHIGEHMVTL